MTVHRTAALLSLLALAACADPKRAVFVTSTSVGINGDVATQTANIGYDRTEGFIGPNFVETGSAPPVFSYIASNLSLFDTAVKQLYATGGAACLVTNGDVVQVDDDDKAKSPCGKKNDELTGRPELMLFGTTNTLGLKAGFDPASGLPSSIVFGYKRKEMSVIPFHTPQEGDKNKESVYASTLASIDLNSGVKSFADSGVRIVQFLATGQAAKNLAGQDIIREVYKAKASDAVSGGQFAAQVAKHAETLGSCVSNADGTIDKGKLDAVLAKAKAGGLVNDSQITSLSAARTAHELQFKVFGVAQGAASGLNTLVTNDQSLCIKKA